MIKLYGRIQPKRLFGEVKISHGAFNGKLQAKTVAPSQEEQTVFPDSGFKGLSHVIVEAATLQEKTITPSGIEQTVIPDVGTYGLSKVIVKAQGNHGLLEEKTVSPSEEEQILTPGDGYYGIQSVTVKAAPLEEKTATSTDQDQTLTPSEGFYGMDLVVVKGIPNAEDYTFCETETFPAIPADVLAANPYAIVVKTSISGAAAYVLTVSASAFFYGKSNGERGLGTAGSGTMYYVNVGGTAWSKVQDFTAGDGVATLDESDALMWANHDVTDVTDGYVYFAKSDVYPAATAEVYRIQKETADDIGREVNRLCGTSESATPARMAEKLGNLNIDLQEITVYPTDEVQTITPDDGYYGFSKITVEAVEDSGGSGGGTEGGGTEGGDTEENYVSSDYVAFGNEFTEIPTLVDDEYKYKLVIRHKETGEIYQISANGVFYHHSFDSWGQTVIQVSSSGAFEYYYPLGTSWGEKAEWIWAIRDDTYDILYTSHDIYEGSVGSDEIWMEGMDPYSDDVTVLVGNPLERDETYIIEGDKLNDLIGAVQGLTGSTEPMTPDEAIEALGDYGTRPAAEEASF